MNIVAKSDLNFHGYSFNTVSEVGSIWLTSTDLAKALGYKKTDAVSQIYARNADEFSDSMTTILNMRVVRRTGDIDMNVRAFSLRGAHLIAMFATTDKAKEFRRWVLDILDREVVNGNINPAFDFEMYAHNAKVAYEHAMFIREKWVEELRPALRLTSSPLAAKLEDHFSTLGAITFGLRNGLARAADKGEIH